MDEKEGFFRGYFGTPQAYGFEIYSAKEGGYFAQCIEYPGIVTQAETYEELGKNMKEALNLYLEEADDDKA